MIFLTGYPGFLGTRLVARLAEKHPRTRFLLLVQPKFMEQAHRNVREQGLEKRTELVEGDITKADLGLGAQYEALQHRITHTFHLAAIYDLSIPREVAWRVNVEGTQHVLGFLEGCAQLKVFGYVSTAYVSGRRTGAIYENELRHKAGFKNYYEETKYHAEILVQERQDRIPTVIFRPSIVVGDSETGETDKLDGPYSVLRTLLRLPRLTVLPLLGSGHRPVNVVPVDYVTAAMAQLAEPEHAGETFHLTDPNPFSAQEMLTLFAQLLDIQAVFLPIPVSLARLLVQTPAGWLLGLTPQIVDYFDFPAYYDARNAERALKCTGISCPPLPNYAPKMIEFLKAHEESVRSEAMY